MHNALRTAAIAAGALATIGGGAGIADAATTTASFTMVRSAVSVSAGCVPAARADVKINSIGPVEVMRVNAHALPKNTEFDLFVTQVPDAPFGVSWYQGDLHTDGHGEASGTFIGRFSKETFSVAPGVAPAPVVHGTDAASNPAFTPVHQFHLGLWFNSPADALKAGCQGGTTPFNGDHTAGVQVLSTRNFGAGNGPLRQVSP